MFRSKNKHATVSASAQTGSVSKHTSIFRGNTLGEGQGSHTTAFVMLEEALRVAVATADSGDDGIIHVTPVFEALLDMANKEEKILSGLERTNPRKLLDDFRVLFEKINGAPYVSPGSPDDIEGNVRNLIGVLEEHFGGGNIETPGLQEFLVLYSKAIPYLNLRDLINDLNKRIVEARDEARYLNENLFNGVKKDFKELKKAHPAIAQLPLPERKAIRKAMRKQAKLLIRSEYAKRNIEAIISDYAEVMNSFPFSTFNHVLNVSDKSRHGGSTVSSAKENFRKILVSADIKTEDAAIYIALLLDFYPLSQTSKFKHQDDVKQDEYSKRKLYTIACDQALTRDNNQDVFAYVVARHWKIMCDAFPSLKQHGKREEIKEKFIEHMLVRWKYADLKPENKIPPKSSGFLQEKEEVEEKKKQKTRSDKWEATKINEIDCKKKIMVLIQIIEAADPSLAHTDRISDVFEGSVSEGSSKTADVDAIDEMFGAKPIDDGAMDLAVAVASSSAPPESTVGLASQKRDKKLKRVEIKPGGPVAGVVAENSDIKQAQERERTKTRTKTAARIAEEAVLPEGSASRASFRRGTGGKDGSN